MTTTDTQNTAKPRAIAMSDIRATYSPGPGRHWFDRDTMRFFGTRLPRAGITGQGGVFFVTSEQPPHGPRAYSVRKLLGEGRIETVGDFCAMSKYDATKTARNLASSV